MKTLSLCMAAFYLAVTGSAVLAQTPGPLTWSSGPDLISPRAECVAILAADNAVLLMSGISPSGDTVVPKLPNGATAWITSHDSDITRMSPGVVRYGSSGILLYGGKNGNEPTDESI